METKYIVFTVRMTSGEELLYTKGVDFIDEGSIGLNTQRWAATIATNGFSPDGMRMWVPGNQINSISW